MCVVLVQLRTRPNPPHLSGVGRVDSSSHPAETTRARSTRSALTENERKVVTLIALSHPSKLVAYELGFSASTVSALLSRALRKLGLKSRAELIELHGAVVGEE